ncbi:hypothetical protein A6302_00229 [Methylobrevis pamukkalensis]|uniref:Uncharacterized protein n=1 Tax=Methylobrevis pamukkalensis TaxID=1439726 RepID=A0A1E3H845_9HYPH|nr:hypothetical protein A6302_00229 [Methylobrevis pamukkalensis]
MPGELRVMLGLSSLFVVLFVLVAGPVTSAATTAARTLF